MITKNTTKKNNNNEGRWDKNKQMISFYILCFHQKDVKKIPLQQSRK